VSARGIRTSQGAAPGTSSRTGAKTRGASGTVGAGGAGDAAHPTVGLTNARTRLVGSRTGVFAESLIFVARLFRRARAATRAGVTQAQSVITSPGWFLLAIMPIALAAGYVFGWTELVVVGWAALALLALASLYLLGRTALAIDLRMVSSRVVVGDAATGEIVVRNPRRARLLGAAVEIPVGAGLIDIVLPGLGSQSRFVTEFVVPTTRRGIVRVGPVRSVRADPIGLVRREIVWTDSRELYVHPRTVALPSMSTGLVRDLEGNPTRDLSTSDMSFHALREYQAGDERRSIHWKSTAKTGRYMVRQFEETRRSHLLIALSLAAADFASDAEFEMAVSIAASLGTRAIRDTRDLTVVVSEKTPDFAARRVFAIKTLATLSPSRLLDDFAGIEQAPNALGMIDVARVTAERVTGVSVAFLVCGSTVSAAQLRAASSQFPVGVETIAVVCDPDSVPGMRRVAGLTVFTVGFLDDLGRFLARTASV
jgi:uncharacterized protein (DUF58 family)